MSEGHSDWEKVEKPLASPPKPKAIKAAPVKKEESGFKGKVGEVKRVLKTGMFGRLLFSSYTLSSKAASLPIRDHPTGIS
jgi:hypothetical protein